MRGLGSNSRMFNKSEEEKRLPQVDSKVIERIDALELEFSRLEEITGS